jgi:hypothetical protein
MDAVLRCSPALNEWYVKDCAEQERLQGQEEASFWKTEVTDHAAALTGKCKRVGPPIKIEAVSLCRVLWKVFADMQPELARNPSFAKEMNTFFGFKGTSVSNLLRLHIAVFESILSEVAGESVMPELRNVLYIEALKLSNALTSSRSRKTSK